MFHGMVLVNESRRSMDAGQPRPLDITGTQGLTVGDDASGDAVVKGDSAEILPIYQAFLTRYGGQNRAAKGCPERDTFPRPHKS
jgi:hypothetical protein